MSQSQAQKSFLSFFVLLLVCDFAAQLAITMQVVELQPLVTIWFGPLDDVFYGLCGLQAIYFMLDPEGETREGAQMSTTAMVKRCASLLGDSAECQGRFAGAFFSGGTRVLVALAGAMAVASVASLAAPVEALVSLRLVLQAHLGYLLPVSAAVAVALSVGLSVAPRSCWMKALFAASVILVISAALDGRLSNHLYHLFAALSNLQAWGAAASWIGVGTAFRREERREVGV